MAENQRQKKTKAERAADLLKKDRFIHNAGILTVSAASIVEQLCGHDGHENRTQTLKKMLHSILFMGNLHLSIYTPEQIFNEEDFYDVTQKGFPEAFVEHRTHVPLKTPFSYFLELVALFSETNRNVPLKETLSRTLEECKKSGDTYPLISVVMCICKSGGSRYYGASLSGGDDIVKEIMTAVSCVKVWHHKVSSVVASVFPEPDGTTRRIKLPASVQCTAYTVENMEEKPPCMTCVQLYSLQQRSDSTPGNKAGNCAETEAISNLLHANDQSQITGGTIDQQEIKRRMEAHFNQKVAERIKKRKNKRSSYSIDQVFT